MNTCLSKQMPLQLDDLVGTLENTGFICGNDIGVESGHYARRQTRCDDFIESQYYNPKLGVKGGRIVTKDICAVCYEDDDIVSEVEIRKKRNIGGKNPLLVCRYCFDKDFEIPCSGGRTNEKEKKSQEKSPKRKGLEENVQSG